VVDTPHARILVDCGLFQGLQALRLRNWEPFPIAPESIDAILLTHAHLDHTGYVPALGRAGFRGRIFATAGTRDLCRIVLPDSGHLQEEDAAYANRKGFSKHAPALPLYTAEEARRVVDRFTAVPFDLPIEVAPGLHATFRPAGHILGSGIITLHIEGARTFVLSGDLGRPTHPLLRPPAPLPRTDVVVVESTYGDRRYADVASLQRFADAIERTAQRGGMVVIPSFAVDRTEVVLFHLRQLVQTGQAPNLPVYVDSPMALAALEVYRQAIAAGSPEINPGVRADPDPFDPGRLIKTPTRAQSIAINAQRCPAIIIAASGMATGGRVLHHLAQRLPDRRNTVMLVGFQTEGTQGRSVKMLGRYVPVRAEVVHVPAFSVHADQRELLDWLRTAPQPPTMTFVVHGEHTAAEAFRTTIEETLGWTVAVPHYLEQVRLD
jgi:metallo-beta-lactamase family protein